ncbi:MAG: ABC transporter ATP-binding protein, partial [Bdellovibrio sp.]|nr:ABC transporter ATP-binding protein [Bdellovibrio sp.]
DHLTAEQLLNYFGVLSGMGGALIRKRIPEVLSQVSLSDFKKLELKKFSKGMLQRIGIAQSLLHDPKVLVFDEPMSGLDPIGRKEIRQLMQSLKAAGKTVFFSTHIIPDVEEICDQVAVIQKGVLKVSGPTHQFKTASEIESFFYEPVAKTSEEKNTHEK